MSVEIVAAAVSLAKPAFRACVFGVEVLRKSRTIGRDGDTARVKLEVELFRLLQWGEASGLQPGMKPNQRLNWPIIKDILQHQEELLTSAHKLRTQYHLDVDEETCNVIGESEEGFASNTTTFSKLVSALKPSIKTQAAKVIQSSNDTISTIKWASIGEKRIKQVIEDIARFNDSLYRLLEIVQQKALEDAVLALMRDLISRTTDARDLDHLHQILSPDVFPDETSLTAAASLKQIRLLLGVDKRPDEENQEKSRPIHTQPRKLTVLKARKLVRSTTEDPNGLEVAHYASKPVLVEWKICRDQNPAIVRTQVEQLALLLSSLEIHSFHTLECRGFLSDEVHNRYALIYSTPETYTETPGMWTLRQGFRSARRPSLSRRIAMGIAIAESVLQLHTAGWLHKGIRPDNVIFLSSPEVDVSDAFIESPVLLGYENARADEPQAMTQTVSTLLDADVYKHPDARGQLRARFRKEFDLYALGCILIELSMWQELLDIFTWPEFVGLRSKIDLANEAGQDIPLPALTDRLPEIRKEIAFQAGDSFCKAVMACFDFEDSEVTDEASLEAQKEVVRRLKDIRV